MLPARRLYGFLFLGMVIAPIIAWQFSVTASLRFLLIWDGGWLLLGLIDGLRGRRQRVTVERSLPPRLSIGRENTVQLTLNNENHRRAASILLRDSYPLEFQADPVEIRHTIDPNATAILSYSIRPNRRGQFQWDHLYLRQIGPWGLTWLNWRIAAPQKADVYPDLIQLRELSLRLTLMNTGTMRQRRRLGLGTEFAELREYSVGDDTRLIDWKATARRNRPLLRVLEPEQEQTLIILLDQGRLMTAQVQGLKRLDWALNATLCLALAGLHRGDRVGIGVFEREVTTWLPPERGQHQLPKILERLSPIQPVFREPDYMGAVTQLVSQQTRRALVVLLTDLIDVTASAELLAAMSRLAPRYLPFCVVLRDPLVDQLARTSTESVPVAYERAVALDLLAQRQVALAQLKQRGVLVLDAPANQISQQLVDRYLNIKSRSLL